MRQVPEDERIRNAAWICMILDEFYKQPVPISLPRLVKRLPKRRSPIGIDKIFWLAAQLENIQRGVLVSEKNQSTDLTTVSDERTKAAKRAYQLSLKIEKLLTKVFYFFERIRSKLKRE